MPLWLTQVVINDFPQVATEMKEVAELRDAVNTSAKRNLLNMIKDTSNSPRKSSNAVPKLKKKEQKFKEITVEDLAQNMNKFATTIT
jgi:hypothetical protein